MNHTRMSSTNESSQTANESTSVTHLLLVALFGVVVTTSVLLNFVGLFFMVKDKELKKHSQHMVFMILTITEITIDVFYLCLFYWNTEFAYLCQGLIIVLSIARNNVFLHLLYLCWERLCAITVSLHSMFNILVQVKTRVIFLGISTVLSFVLIAPPYLLYTRNSKPEACFAEDLLAENSRFVFGYCRTVYCIEIIMICVTYTYLTKKIRTLIGISFNWVERAQNTTSVTMDAKTSDPNSEKNLRKNQNTLQVHGAAGLSRDTTPEWKQEKAGLKWKLRAFKMTQSTILATVIPSTPMIVLQFAGYIKPEILNRRMDMVISMCNTAHAVIFPLVFIATVKHLKFCKK